MIASGSIEPNSPRPSSEQIKPNASAFHTSPFSALQLRKREARQEGDNGKRQVWGRKAEELVLLSLSPRGITRSSQILSPEAAGTAWGAGRTRSQPCGQRATLKGLQGGGKEMSVCGGWSMADMAAHSFRNIC